MELPAMQRENLIFKVGMFFGTVPYQPDRIKGEGSTLTVSLTVKRLFFYDFPLVVRLTFISYQANLSQISLAIKLTFEIS